MAAPIYCQENCGRLAMVQDPCWLRLCKECDSKLDGPDKYDAQKAAWDKFAAIREIEWETREM